MLEAVVLSLSLEDSKSRSRLTDTNLTAGASFHSRCTRSMLQAGRLGSAALRRGMALPAAETPLDPVGQNR